VSQEHQRELHVLHARPGPGDRRPRGLRATGVPPPGRAVSSLVRAMVLREQRGAVPEGWPAGPDSGGHRQVEGGGNDGAYWLDLPADGDQRERAVKRGDHAGARAYVQAKPMLGGTATDLVLWLFYPFNGPARAKVGPLTVRLGCIGEHVTLRVSNFSGALARPGLLLPAQRG
jgi:hypothetical protein